MGIQTKDAVSTFLANVFTYMGGALAITGLLAYWFGNTPSLMTYLINPMGGANSFRICGYVFSARHLYW